MTEGGGLFWSLRPTVGSDSTVYWVNGEWVVELESRRIEQVDIRRLVIEEEVEHEFRLLEAIDASN